MKKIAAFLFICLFVSCSSAEEKRSRQRIYDIIYLNENLKGKIQAAELTYNIKVNYNMDSLTEELYKLLDDNSIDTTYIYLLEQKLTKEVKIAINESVKMH